MSRSRKKRAGAKVATAAASLAMLAAAPVQAASTTDLPALLARVGTHVEKIEARLRTLDYEEHSVDEQLDEAGKPLHRVEKSRRVLQARGVRKQELLKLVQDGKDVTAAARLGMGTSLPDDGGNPHPLLPSEQARYRFEPAPVDPKHPSWVAIAFSPRGAKSPELLEGVFLVDPRTAFLRQMRCHPAQLPPNTKRMDLVLHYDQLTPDGALQSKMESTIEAGAQGFHQHLRSVVTYHFEVK